MLAEPRLSVPRYLQGWALDINFFDCAKVIEKGLEITVPFDSYKDVLLPTRSARWNRIAAPSASSTRPRWALFKSAQ
jgi:hypothetical protein